MMVEMTMGFDPRRVEVTSCVLRGAGELGRRLNAEGVPLQFFDAHRFSLLPLSRIVSLVRRKQIDVIHVTDFQADTLGRVAGMMTGKPVIVHVRTHHSKYQKRPYPWYMERVNHLLAPSTALAIANQRYAEALELVGHPELAAPHRAQWLELQQRYGMEECDFWPRPVDGVAPAQSAARREYWRTHAERMAAPPRAWPDDEGETLIPMPPRKI
jgi:hypothetical protein